MSTSQSPRNILVTGTSGMVGGEFVRQLEELGHNVWRLKRTTSEDGGVNEGNTIYVDLTDDRLARSVIDDTIGLEGISIIIHCAAAKDINWCEINRRETWDINVSATRMLAEIAAERDILLVFMSSDAVFHSMDPIMPVEDDKPNPKNVYGMSKMWAEGDIEALGGDLQYLIIRTGMIYGNHHGNSAYGLLSKMRDSNPIINTPFGYFVQPVYVKTLVHNAIALMLNGYQGIWHVSSMDRMSRFEFVSALADAVGSAAIIQTSSDEEIWPQGVERSRYCYLDVSKLLEVHLNKSIDLKFPEFRSEILDFVGSYEAKEV